jgi:hypothetical protein
MATADRPPTPGASGQNSPKQRTDDRKISVGSESVSMGTDPGSWPDECEDDTYDVHYMPIETEPESTGTSRPIEATAKRCLKKRTEGKCALQEMRNKQSKPFWGGVPKSGVPKSKKCGERIRQNLRIEGVTCSVVLDTGAPVSLIPLRVVKQLGARKGKHQLMEKIRKSKVRVKGIGAGMLEIRDEVSLLVDSRNTFAKVTFLIDEKTERIGDQSGPIILGTNGMAALGYSLFSPGGESLMTSTNYVADMRNKWKQNPKLETETVEVGISRVGARLPTGGMLSSPIKDDSEPSFEDSEGTEELFSD